MCKSWCELIIGLIVGVFALFLWGWMYTQWVMIVLAIVLIIHSFVCRNCWCCCDGECRMHGKKQMAKPMKKK